jgi:methionyl-tRNA formyltransferase
VYDFVRGLSPYPAAWTFLGDKSCKVYKTSIVTDFESNEDIPVGQWVSDHKSYLYFKCAEGWLAIEELQLEMKKRMGIQDFLRGYKL